MIVGQQPPFNNQWMGKIEFEVITECSDTERVVFSVQENVWSADSKLLSKKEASLGFQNV